MLKENVRLSRYQMSDELEGLASELSLSGGNAWEKLQGTVTSQLTVDFELDGKMQKLPMPALINLRSHPDENTRRRAYEAENAAWESVKETAGRLPERRQGRGEHAQQAPRAQGCGALRPRRGAHRPPDAGGHAGRDARAPSPCSGSTSRPRPRSWARRSWPGGTSSPRWGRADKVYTFEEARDFILENFGNFSPDLRAFAKRAFDNRWIDAEQRDGKRGGAFCMGVPSSQGKPRPVQLRRLVRPGQHHRARAGARLPQRVRLRRRQDRAAAGHAHDAGRDRLHHVRDDRDGGRAGERRRTRRRSWPSSRRRSRATAQVIVDIYSRYLFEKEVFERRDEGRALGGRFLRDHGARPEGHLRRRAGRALSAEVHVDLEAALLLGRACRSTTSPTPSACSSPPGCTPSTSSAGAAFVQDYKSAAGLHRRGDAAGLAERFGIDIRTRKFWEDSLAIIGRQIDRFCEI